MAAIPPSATWIYGIDFASRVTSISGTVGEKTAKAGSREDCFQGRYGPPSFSHIPHLTHSQSLTSFSPKPRNSSQNPVTDFRKIFFADLKVLTGVSPPKHPKDP